MANYVAGHVDDPDLMDSLIGIEFEPENNRAVAYINEEEIILTCTQVWLLERMCSQVVSQMHWHEAEWVTAREGTSKSTEHLMKKGEHDRMGKTLCGRLPSHFSTIIGGWNLAPVLGEPSRRARNKFMSGMCQRCLAVYDKRVKEVQS